MILLAFDSETHLIEEGNIAPPMVCGIFTTRNPETGELEARVLGNHPDDGLEEMIEWMLTDDEVFVVTQRGGFDYAVICRTFPRLIPAVFAKLVAGLATDTMWREKLLNLSTTGRLEKMEMPDGSKVNISYSMEALAASYLGVDLSEQKTDQETSWRTNFNVLDGWQASEYPEDAYAYAAADGEYTYRIYEGQEARKDEWEMASTETEEFQIVKDFVLYLAGAHGMAVNPEATEEMGERVVEVIDANKDLLEASGILRSADLIGPPYAKDLDRAYEQLTEQLGLDNMPAEIEDDEWTDYAPLLEGIKFKKPKGKPGTKSKAALQAHLEALYKKLGEIPTMTEGGEKAAPAIKCDEEVRVYLATKCPVMAQYNEREALGKIRTQMLPVLRSGPVVYPSYDAIKETGRTSSYDGGKAKDPVTGVTSKTLRNYPSVNRSPGRSRGSTRARASSRATARCSSTWTSPAWSWRASGTSPTSCSASPFTASCTTRAWTCTATWAVSSASDSRRRRPPKRSRGSPHSRATSSRPFARRGSAAMRWPCSRLSRRSRPTKRPTCGRSSSTSATSPSRPASGSPAASARTRWWNSRGRPTASR